MCELPVAEARVEWMRNGDVSSMKSALAVPLDASVEVIDEGEG